MKTLKRPQLELEISDDPNLNMDPDLDKLYEPQDGDIYILLYTVRGDKAVLVSVSHVPVPVRLRHEE